MDQNGSEEFTPEQIKRFESACELTKEVIKEQNIPDANKEYVEKTDRLGNNHYQIDMIKSKSSCLAHNSKVGTQ